MTQKQKKVTIYDIAQRAGVSTGTVSRYINGVGTPHPDIEEKLKEAIEHFHYVPNRSARALKSQRKNMICMAFPETDNPFFFELVDQVEKRLKDAGYNMMIYHTHGRLEDEIRIIQMTQEGLMDGLLLLNFNFTDELFQAIHHRGCPVVICGLCVSPYGGNKQDEFDYVGIDVSQALYDMTCHMVDQGHTRIAYVGGSKELRVFRERYDGYASALMQRGIPFEEELCFTEFGFGEEAGYQAGLRLTDMENRPTAVCAASDVIAYGIMKACQEKHMRIPEDVALIGLDNDRFDELLTPALSSVNMMQRKMGDCAIDFLMKRIKGNEMEPKKIVFRPELVIRKSSVKDRQL